MAVRGVLRILCAAIDVIFIMIPVQFVMMGVFNVSGSQADLLFKFLFAVYGVLFMEQTKGKTLGKMFGKLKVIDKDSGPKSIMYLGLREMAKTLYFIPYIGWALCLVSVFMMFFKDGRAIHDYVGGTKVIYAWQDEAAEITEGGGDDHGGGTKFYQ